MSTPPLFRDFEVHELIAEERQKAPEALFLDFGPPLPSRYGVDRIQLMVQSPSRVFAYWELTGKAVSLALSRFPAEERQNLQLMLKWRESGMPERWFDIGTTSSWWFPTSPESCCQAELALYSEDWGWIPLLTSQVVLTPRRTLGPASTAAGEPEARAAFLQDLVQQTGIEQELPDTVQAGQLETSQAELGAPAPTTEASAVPQAEATTSSIRPTELRLAGSWSVRRFG